MQPRVKRRIRSWRDIRAIRRLIKERKIALSLSLSLSLIVEGKYIQGNNREKEKEKVGFRIAGSVLQNSTRDEFALDRAGIDD